MAAPSKDDRDEQTLSEGGAACEAGASDPFAATQYRPCGPLQLGRANGFQPSHPQPSRLTMTYRPLTAAGSALASAGFLLLAAHAQTDSPRPPPAAWRSCWRENLTTLLVRRFP